jgi:glyoxylase-like metal-dependent hydrolase (beta-lactamase superfamily II)
MIVKSLVVGPIETNCFLLADEATGKGTIIDPGGHPERILAAAEEMKLEVQCIIATHGHFDHIAGIPGLKERLGCEFLLHESDLFFVQKSKLAALNWGFDIEQVPDPDRYIEDGEIISLGGLKLEVIHTPGHSPGGISLYIREENTLFAGDTLFLQSVGRTDLPYSSAEDLILSIKNRLYTLPDDTVVYTGHGEPTSIGAEKKGNFFVQG